MPTLFAKYYRPGLITLILLPLMCSPMLYEHFFPQKLYALEMNMPRENGYENYHFPPPRNYIQIDLTGKHNKDEKSIRLTEALIDNFVATKDSTHGIDVHLSSNISYQTFITLVDICNFGKAKIYGWKENDFWFIPFAKNSKIQSHPATCGNTALWFNNYASPKNDDAKKTLWKVFINFFSLHKAQ